MSTFISLKGNPNHGFLFTGSLFSNAAQWLQFITIGWLALEVSGSMLHSIMAVAVRALPTLLLSPWGGVLADRMDRRLLALITTIGMSVAAAVFATLISLNFVTNVWYVYVYTLVTGVGVAFNQPVRFALTANVVPEKYMTNALALNAMAVTSMRLCGAMLGGSLMVMVGFEWNFIVEASLYMGTALLLLPMRTPYREPSNAKQSSPFNNLLEGIHFILNERVMFRLMLLNFVRTGVFMPLLLLMPAYTSEVLGAGPGIGTAMMVSMGVGGVIASFIMSSWGFFTRRGLVCLLTLVSGCMVFTVLGLSSWVGVSVGIMVIMGLSQSHFIVSNQTLVQKAVPDTLRGRVSSVWHYEQGLIPLFSLVIGLIGSLIGMALTMTIYGAIAVVLTGIFLIRFKDIRELD
jgi:MFS family permease